MILFVTIYGSICPIPTVYCIAYHSSLMASNRATISTAIRTISRTSETMTVADTPAIFEGEGEDSLELVVGWLCGSSLYSHTQYWCLCVCVLISLPCERVVGCLLRGSKNNWPRKFQEEKATVSWHQLVNFNCVVIYTSVALRRWQCENSTNIQYGVGSGNWLIDLESNSAIFQLFPPRFKPV